MKKRIEIYDTTLRDGAQQKNINFSLEDKIKVIKILSDFGVDFIEAGWPGSNHKDTVLFKKIFSNPLINKEKIVAFGMTCKKNKKPKDDIHFCLLLGSKAKIVTIVGKSCVLQVKNVLNTSLKENLRMIFESIKFAKEKGKRVFFDAEHFFDGFKRNPSFSLKVLKTAQKAGAERIVLCDTNGGSLPFEIRKIVKIVKKEIKVPLGIHCHNDSGLALANSLEAIKAGVFQVQGTINGYGERCGNADLSVLIPTLQFKLKIPLLEEEKLKKLKELSRQIAQIANQNPNPFQPYVGENAFLTKAGLHGDGILKWKESYLHCDPEKVGNEIKFSLSEISGKSILSLKAKELGFFFEKEKIEKIIEEIKRNTKMGLIYENAEASLELFLAKKSKKFYPFFQPIFFEVKIVYNKKFLTQCKLKIKIKNKIFSAKALGQGPVNALDKALRKILKKSFPKLSKVKLIDYKVRILEGESGTQSDVLVLIESSDGIHKWTTGGVSSNIILASFQALSDSLQYPLYKNF